MKVILRRLESIGDLAFATDEQLDTDRITIGRGTDQHVELPDMRLSLEHSEIREVRSGEFLIESRTLTGAWVNGVPAPSHPLQPGDVIDCGRFRLTLGIPPPGIDLLLEIQERLSAREEKAQRRDRYRLGLAAGGLRMRRPAWLLAAAVLLVALLLPLLLRYAVPDLGGGLAMDRLWESGPRSSAHSQFLADCASCHQEPFRQVSHQACESCHRVVAPHSRRPELNALPGMGDARCGSCHLEHSGDAALRASADSSCTGCHANPEPRFAGAGLAPAVAFGTRHPPFSPTLPRYQPGTGIHFQSVPMSAGTALQEDTQLTFPHDIHLDDAGLRGPEGNRVLDCSDCHEPAGRGEAFKPVQMNAHCASCHRLDFDPNDPARVVPHAQPAEVVRIIQDYYARLALAGEVRDDDAPSALKLRRVPGETLGEDQRRAALQWADGRATQVVGEVFTRRVCATCHEVEPPGPEGAGWRVAPVALSGSYLRGARFDHAAHRTEDCGACHAAATNADSRTLMLPDLASCRGCHGDPGESSRVATPCSGCHTFHLVGRHAAAASGVPAP